MNQIKCGECRYGIAADPDHLELLCDNPILETYCKNEKHNINFSCGFGVYWVNDCSEYGERE